MISLVKNKQFGTTLFYILWPIIWLYVPLKIRVRVIIRCEKDVLMVKNWFGPNSWQLPGGGMKSGESVSSTASREIYEELGLIIKETKFKLLTEKVVLVRQFGLNYRYHYAVFDVITKPTLELSSEISSISWTKIDKVKIPKAISASL